MVTAHRQSLVRVAVGNNARWCATMSRAHGVIGESDAQSWTAPARTPLYYPDAVTLAPGADPAALLARIDTATPGASVKDSFADLDLTPAGFSVLFEAQWIHRPAGPAAPGSPVSGGAAPEIAWEIAADPTALRAWALAWDDGNGSAELFRPELLDDPYTFVLAGQSGAGRVVAGAVASRTDDVVGVSNVFAPGGPDAAWPALLGALHSLFPGRPVVGYEQGEDLAGATRHGFEQIGPLRIWQHAG